MGEHDGHRNRLRQKFRSGKLKNPTDAQLLELLLYHSISRRDVRPLAETLIREAGSLGALLSMPEEELMELPGVGESTAFLLALTGEASKRCEEQRMRACALSAPEEVRRYIYPRLRFLKEEVMYVICLDGNLRPVSCEIVGARELLIKAVAGKAAMAGATAVIMVGNSLSEFPTMSAAYLENVKRINVLLSELGIVLVDYMKIKGELYSSAAELGVLDDAAPIRIHYRTAYMGRAPERIRYKVSTIYDEE